MVMKWQLPRAKIANLGSESIVLVDDCVLLETVSLCVKPSLEESEKKSIWDLHSVTFLDLGNAFSDFEDSSSAITSGMKGKWKEVYRGVSELPVEVV
ncbi:GroES-like protein [Moniliophthora roreri]|nr:GroES-like protein [Moniliophthora roreri]